MLKRALLAAAALVATGTAIANDSTAEMTTGGLVLRNSRHIDMVEEDLFVSVRQVRVNYVFRNQGRADERVIVAFPMPDRPLEEESFGGDRAFVHDFETRVEGRLVRTQVERKAMVGARDHTALLTGLRVPLSPPEDGGDGLDRALARLSPADLARLTRLGLVRMDGTGADRQITPLWTFKETYYWTQTFPAGRDLRVTHRYAPGAGGSVGSAVSIPSLRGEPETRRMIRDYCIDRDFQNAIERMRRAGGADAILPERTVGYVLTTGANWRAPIRSFRLVVDKGRPDNIVSFCGTGIRRISPTQFEVRHTNWRPDRDLRVLILSPAGRYSDDD